MAEFCLECYKEILGTDIKKKYILSKYLDLCEGCGEYKQVVIREKTSFFFVKRMHRKLGNFLRRKIR